MISQYFPRMSRWRIVYTTGFTIGLFCIGTLACSDLSGPPDLPSGTQDPSALNTPAGALQLYQTAIVLFADAQVHAIAATGTLADEFQSAIPYRIGIALDELDMRSTTEGATISVRKVYEGWQRVRGQVAQALGVIRKYAPELSTALQGHLYALSGFAEVGLADFFCSGVPLSTIDFEKDFTYSPGLSTEEIYWHAIALFDTAIQLAVDSAPIVRLAYVGKARALNALGEFEAAATVADSVPDHFQYTIPIRMPTAPFHELTVPDREGGNGLPFHSDSDPRIALFATRLSQSASNQYFPAKYPFNVSSTLVVADWIEARLIRAEADLYKGKVDAWIDTLNSLRRNAIAPALSMLVDPGTQEERVNLLFKERAYWLFATAHRQSDLRRLVRQYGRSQYDVFPVGMYLMSAYTYGNDIDVQIPKEERRNPLFTGCLNRDI
jgi:hypothetical protein